MPDLLTHALFAYPAKKIFPEKLVFILIGSILPDLLGRALGVFISNSSFVYWLQLAIHTPLSLLLFAYSLSFFFPEKDRKTVFILILIGVISHFFLDLFQKTITVGNLWFFPFSFASPQIQLIWPDESIFTIPLFLIVNIFLF